jgi:hypothetical protein
MHSAQHLIKGDPAALVGSRLAPGIGPFKLQANGSAVGSWANVGRGIGAPQSPQTAPTHRRNVLHRSIGYMGRKFCRQYGQGACQLASR